jgi:integrase
MKGTIVERPKGSRNFSIRYSAGFDAVTGKYRQVWESGFSSITDARKRLNELEHERNTGILPKSDNTTLGDYLLHWFEDNKTNLSPKTAQGYESIIKIHIIPAIGSITLSKLTPEDVQHYYTAKLHHGRCDGKGALSSTTVNHHHACLHRALKSAVSAHLIYYNPAEVEDKPKLQHPEIETLTEDEVNILLRVARSTEYYCLFLTYLLTGARRGELLALRWSDLELLQAEMHIIRNVIQLNDRSLFYKATKSGKGRMVALTPETALALRQHKEKREAVCATLKIPFTPDSLVFCHADGSSLLPDSVSQAWTRLVANAGLKHIKLHGTRHTHATLLLQQNVHPLVVSQRLGHSKISTTLDLYSHVKPELQKAAAVQLDKILEKSNIDL